MLIVSQYREKADVFNIGPLRWQKIAPKYPLTLRRRYFKQWELESQILGYCAVYEEDNVHARRCVGLVPTCPHMRNEEYWMRSDMCGPRFIRKYIERGDDDAKSPENRSVQDHAQDDQGV